MPASAAPSAPRGLLRRLEVYGDLVRFAHTLFALPWALAGLLLGARGWPEPETLGWVLLAMVGARTAAMSFNRLVDRRFDASNPRTANRPSVTGAVSPAAMLGLTLASCALFVLAAALLNPLCFALSPLALLVLLGYSLTKRFTPFAHMVLGLALGLSPLGAYLAVTGSFDAMAGAAALLGAAVLAWTSGFDIFYACQDVAHDRREGLHSIPSWLGIPRALVVSRVAHAGVPLALAGAGLVADLGPVYWVGVGLVALLLAYEHRLVRADDLSKVGKAFFQVNVAISLLMLLVVFLDLVILGGAS